MQYSIHGFAKDLPASQLKGQSGPLITNPVFPEDEEALDLVYDTFPGKFQSKFQMTGKRR